MRVAHVMHHVLTCIRPDSWSAQPYLKDQSDQEYKLQSDEAPTFPP